jgi:lauroyl/myristoyl acyltransferase
VLYRPPKQAWLQPLIESGPRRGQPAPGAGRSVRRAALLKALKRREAVGMLPDQVPGTGEGVWADFFGRPAYTMTLAARLTETGRATVLMAYAERLPGGARLPSAPDAPETPIEGPGERAPAINRALEALIRRCPAIPVGLQPLQGAARRGAARWSRHADPSRPRPHLAAALPAAGTAGAAGRGFGGLLYAFGRERRHIALTNLRLCYPRMPEAEREQLARAHFRAFGRSFLERGLLWWSPAEAIRRLVRVEGLERVRAWQASR